MITLWRIKESGKGGKYEKKPIILSKLYLVNYKMHIYRYLYDDVKNHLNAKDNEGLFLKGIYDLNLPYKFVVSGLGSLELKEKNSRIIKAENDYLNYYPYHSKNF